MYGGSVPGSHVTCRRFTLPWHWSDDLAHALLAIGKVDPDTVAAMSVAPVAFRRDSDSVEDVAMELAEDGEIPLAA